MKNIYEYHPKGTCSKLMQIEVDGGCIGEVTFIGGCKGNLRGIAALIKGLPIKEVADKLQGIPCGERNTSCPDQLSKALYEILAKKA